MGIINIFGFPEWKYITSKQLIKEMNDKINDHKAEEKYIRTILENHVQGQKLIIEGKQLSSEDFEAEDKEVEKLIFLE